MWDTNTEACLGVTWSKAFALLHSKPFLIHDLRFSTFPSHTLIGYSFGTPQADQYAPQVPPPPTTPGTAPLGFAPATTPTQDLSKAPTGQPDFPYSQYGKKSIIASSSLQPLSVPCSLYVPWPRPSLLKQSIGCNYKSFCGYVHLQYKRTLALDTI